jgi:hypothetical protein
VSEGTAPGADLNGIRTVCACRWLLVSQILYVANLSKDGPTVAGSIVHIRRSLTSYLCGPPRQGPTRGNGAHHPHSRSGGIEDGDRSEKPSFRAYPHRTFQNTAKQSKALIQPPGQRWRGRAVHNRGVSGHIQVPLGRVDRQQLDAYIDRLHVETAEWVRTHPPSAGEAPTLEEVHVPALSRPGPEVGTWAVLRRAARRCRGPVTLASITSRSYGTDGLR